MIIFRWHISFVYLDSKDICWVWIVYLDRLLLDFARDINTYEALNSIASRDLQVLNQSMWSLYLSKRCLGLATIVLELKRTASLTNFLFLKQFLFNFLATQFSLPRIQIKTSLWLLLKRGRWLLLQKLGLLNVLLLDNVLVLLSEICNKGEKLEDLMAVEEFVDQVWIEIWVI